MPQQVIAGRHELLERPSHGGMGDVWRGYDAVLDRPVAVKLIRLDLDGSASWKRASEGVRPAPPQPAPGSVARAMRPAAVTSTRPWTAIPDVPAGSSPSPCAACSGR